MKNEMSGTALGVSQPCRIRTYPNERSAFDPDAIDAMSKALEEACKALQVNGVRMEREVIAARIIDLAHNGVPRARCQGAKRPRAGGDARNALPVRPPLLFDPRL